MVVRACSRACNCPTWAESSTNVLLRFSFLAYEGQHKILIESFKSFHYSHQPQSVLILLFRFFLCLAFLVTKWAKLSSHQKGTQISISPLSPASSEYLSFALLNSISYVYKHVYFLMVFNEYFQVGKNENWISKRLPLLKQSSINELWCIFTLCWNNLILGYSHFSGFFVFFLPRDLDLI